MARSLSKKATKSKTKVNPAPAGRILEMRPVPPPRARRGFSFGLFILALVAVVSITMAALSFRQMAASLVYAQAAGNELVSAKAQANDLKTRVADLETLQTLAQKVAAPAVPTDLVWVNYSSPNISLKYPQGYTVVKATSNFPALTIKNDKGTFMIFKPRDFTGGSLPLPMIGRVADNGSDISLSLLLSPDNKAYDVWVENAKGDAATRAVLDQIVASIKLSK